MLVAAAVGLVTAKIGAGRRDFCSAIDRVDGYDNEGLDAGVALTDQRRAGLQMEVIASHGVVLPGIIPVIVSRQREVDK